LKDIYHKVLTVTATIPERGCVLPSYIHTHTHTLCQKSVPAVLNVTCPHPYTHIHRAEFELKVS